MKIQRRAFTVLTAAAALLCSPTHAAKPIELVVPYAAGGYTDTVARHLAEALSQVWGEPVVVLNKAGGASVIGTRYVIDQGGGDGRTLLMGSLGFLTMQFSARGVLFDPQQLSPVVNLGGTPSVLYIRSGIPANSFAEFVRWAKRTPGGVNFGTSGVASSPHLNAEDLAARAGFPIVNIAYPGSSASIPAMAGGHIDAVFESSGSRNIAATGRIKPLLVGSVKPLPTWPEVPTADAAGLQGFRSGSWFGILVPAKTPPALQRKLNADINAVLSSPALAEQLRQMDFQPAGGTPEEFARFLNTERQRLDVLMKARNIHVE